ncbi:TlpA family protein disulfide reductase [Aurantibacter aestuarii]|uniref:TlpA family protein disulfide reductase n=1 Tax=Aurantibacter aestuarii TaxID=1266046 RepID=A0A2T1NCB9_9FLAO|nr:TlpA disulfide reductase family protein [Aurantibacter aestuarii]PSG90090.1 TlpA family protein disulfide reductase [Aurantibacter aestuarii]
MKKLFFLVFSLPMLVWSQHSVSGVFSPAKDYKIAILYKVTPTQLVYENHSAVDSLGQFHLTIKDQAEKGMYKVVYAMPQEEYNFDVIYNNEDVVVNFQTDKGSTFITSEENKLWQSYNKSMRLVNESLKNFFNSKNQSESNFLKLIKVLKQTQTEYEKAASNKLVSNFIVAKRPYFPTTYKNEATFIKEKKTHYFDYLDFKNIQLLNSSVLVEASFDYVYTFVDANNVNASLKENIDTLVAQIGAQNGFKNLILELLWRQFSSTKEEIANYIANQYLLEIVKETSNDALLAELNVLQQTSIGTKAPNFDFDNTSLYQLESSDYYIVAFWSSTCGHCLTEMPILQDFVKQQPKNKIEVIAIGLESEPEFWTKKIKEFKTFTHVYGEGKWENTIGDAYNVKATPTFFILNKSKEILAKPYDVAALKAFFTEKAEY